MLNTESILTSIKKLLGISEEYTQFDVDIIIHINATFFILNQLGVGPECGFSIKDESSVWDDFIVENANLEIVKSYIHMKVKLLFDPPISSAVLDSMNRTINEFEWRLQVATDPKILHEEEEIQNE